MKIFISILLFLLIIFPTGVWGATGNISQVVFTSDEQVVSPGSVSGAITIQLQNSDGTEEKLDDTADITFTSTGTGEFLGSTGKPITKTMSKGSANKTFYYKDDNAGVYTLKVTVVPRSGGGEWSASQSITVGEGGSNDSDNEKEKDSGEDDSSGDDSEEEAVSGKTSSHSISAKLSSYEKKASIKIGAGRPRTVLVNTPIYFEPETNEVKKTNSKKGEFIWSFGDGDSDSGRIVKHIYYFPGDYNVVLNTNKAGEKSVSRTKVKVIEPSLEIVEVVPGDHGYVEIKNNNNLEVNINGWSIKSGKREYSVAEDTIINPKSSIKIPNKVMHFDPGNNFSFLYPNDEVHMVYEPKQTKVSFEALSTTPVPVTYYQAPVYVPKEEILPILDNTPAAVIEAESTNRIIRFFKSIFTVH